MTKKILLFVVVCGISGIQAADVREQAACRIQGAWRTYDAESLEMPDFSGAYVALNARGKAFISYLLNADYYNESRLQTASTLSSDAVVVKRWRRARPNLGYGNRMVVDYPSDSTLEQLWTEARPHTCRIVNSIVDAFVELYRVRRLRALPSDAPGKGPLSFEEFTALTPQAQAYVFSLVAPSQRFARGQRDAAGGAFFDLFAEGYKSDVPLFLHFKSYEDEQLGYHCYRWSERRAPEAERIAINHLIRVLMRAEREVQAVLRAANVDVRGVTLGGLLTSRRAIWLTLEDAHTSYPDRDQHFGEQEQPALRLALGY